MIEFLRKYSRSWPAKIVIILIAVALVVTIWQSSGTGTGGAYTVATVGGEDVPAIDVVRRLRQQAAMSNIPEQLLAGTAEGRGYVLSQLLEQRALAAEAAELGLDAPDWAVAEAVRNEPAFQDRQGGFAETAYEYALRQMGQSRQNFEEELRREISATLLIASVAGNNTVSLPEVTTEILWRREGEERDLVYVVLPLETIAEPETPDDATLQEFYDADPEAFRVPERRKLRILVMSPEDRADVDAVSEEDARAVYEANIATFVRAERRNLQQLEFETEEEAAAALARIGDGESFAALAAEQGVGAGQTDYGYVSKEELARFQPELAEAAFAETAADQSVVGPTMTKDDRAVIVMIAGIEPGVERGFEDAREEIAQGVALARAREGLPELRFEVEDLRAQGIDFAAIAEEERFRVVEAVIDQSGLDETGAPAVGLPQSPDVAQRAFAMKAIDDPDAAFDEKEMDLAATQDGGFYALEVTEIQETYLPEFAEVKDKVAARWAATQRRKTLDERAETIRTRFEADEDPTALAAEFGLDLQSAEGLKRGAAYPELPNTLITSAFAAPAADATGVALIDQAAGGQARIIAKISEVRELDAEADRDALVAVAERERASFEGDLAALFRFDVRRRQVTMMNPDAAIPALVQQGLIAPAGGAHGGM